MNRPFYLRAVILALIFNVSWLPLAGAETIHWRTNTVYMAVEGKDLKDVLRDFFASEHINARIAPDIAGKVTGRFDMSAQKFLDTLAATFGFTWFFDGTLVAVTGENDITREVIKLNFASTDDLAAMLNSMHLSDRHFPLTYDASTGTAVVSGPAAYVQLVAQVAKQLDQSAESRVGSIVRVFKLRHAWAADHIAHVEGETVNVPGIASLLDRLYHGQASKADDEGLAASIASRLQGNPVDNVRSGAGGAVTAERSLMPPLPGLSAPVSALFSNSGPLPSSGISPPLLDVKNLSYDRIADLGKSGNTPSAAGKTEGRGLPVIEADPGTNSVLIRDVPQRIGLYADVIRKLDEQPRLIQIEAHIIEIDDDALRALGVDWRIRGKDIAIDAGSSGATGSLGGGVTAVLGDGKHFLARVNALAGESEAKVDATPIVATLDNVEALMNSERRFFVRVPGYTSSSLYSVSAGISLRVLPMVVEGNGEIRFKLNVHIRDGQVTAQRVDNIPVIATTEIDTQSFVRMDQSLLIAGYSVDQGADDTVGIPGLSEIPVLGALFRSHSHEKSHMTRLFMITPRLVSLSPEASSSEAPPAGNAFPATSSGASAPGG
jgi:type III secretion protein C